jgi:hypothetical protein
MERLLYYRAQAVARSDHVAPHHDRAGQTLGSAVHSRSAHHRPGRVELAGGMTEQQLLDDYPELEPADFRTVYEFAARLGRRVAR